MPITALQKQRLVRLVLSDHKYNHHAEQQERTYVFFYIFDYLDNQREVGPEQVEVPSGSVLCEKLAKE